MSQETLNLIIGTLLGSVSTLLAIVIGYFFQRKSDERKRKWELEDRLTNRSIAIRYKRIEEAQSYIETMLNAGKKLESNQRELVVRKNVEVELEDIKRVGKIWGETALLLNAGTIEVRSLYLLDDYELHELLEKLLIIFNTELNNQMELFETVQKKGTVDKETISKRLSAFDSGVFEITTEMHRRLDELAKTVS